MFTRLFSFVAVLVLSLPSALAANLGGLGFPGLDSQGIMGGMAAAKNEFPSIVSLQNESDGHFCGGTLIKKNWVLTAAHCINNVGTPDTILVGLYDQTKTGGAETITPKKVVVHPKNDPSNNDYDFALIELSKPSAHEPARLGAQAVAGPVNLIAVGWGYLDSDRPQITNELRKVALPFVPFRVCEQSYPGQLTSSMMCAGPKQGGKDTCQGDSGGPLYLGSGAGAQLVGVTSWGNGCGVPGQYGIYAEVSAVLPWIAATTK